MAALGLVKGIEISFDNADFDCIACIQSKSHRSSIKKSRLKLACQPPKLVHTDFLGPLEVPSLGGARYVITFIDDFTNWTVKCFIRQKSESFNHFKHYKAYADNHTNYKLKMLKIHS